MTKLGEVFVEVTGNADPLAKSIDDALSGVEDRAAGFGDRFESALTGPVAKGAAAVGGAAAVAIGAGVTQAINLDGQLREVVTLFGETGGAAEASVKGLQAPVRDLSTTIGIAQSEITDGLYQAISAGVPRENVFQFLETAGRFAIGGVTDTETAVDGLTTAINAFGLDSADAESVADSFFAAVQGGKTNAEELSASLFNVAPSASAAGLSLQETLAATAALTASGVPTSVATTQIRAAIEELNDPSREVAQVFEELTGKTFREFTAQGGTLEEALGIIGDAASDSGMQIGELFGSVQASAAATTLYNDASGAFANNLNLQADAAGAAANAYELVAAGAGQQLEVLKQQGLALLSTLGQTFLPIVNQVVGFLVRMAQVFTGLPEPIQRFLAILTGAVAVLGPLPLIIGKMLPLFRSFGTVLGIATKAFRLLNLTMLANPIVLIVAAVAALVAAFIWAWNNIDGFREFFVNLWDAIKAAAEAVVGWFRDTAMPALAAAWDVVKAAAQTAWDILVAVFDGIVEAAQRFWEGVQAAFEAVRDVAGAVADWFRDYLGPIFDAWVELVSAVFDRFREAWQAAWDFITGIWSGTGEPTIGAIGTAFEVMQAVVGAVWDAVVGFVQHAWDIIVGIWNAVGEPLLDAIKTGWEILRDAIALVWEAIRTIVETAMTIIAEIIHAIASAIRGDWQGVWDSIRGIVDVVWEAIKTLVTSAITFVQTTIARVLGAISALWSGIWTAIRTTVSTVWSTIRSVVSAGINAVRNVIRSVMTAIRNLIRSAWNAAVRLVRTAMTNMRTAVRTGLNNVMTLVRGLPGRIRSAVSNFGTLLLNAGRRLINGLIRGIRERISAIGDAIKDAASTVTRFWPFSPAKEGPLRTNPPEAAGANIIGLLAGGMEANLGQLTAAARSAAQAALIEVAATSVPLPVSFDESAPVGRRPAAVTPSQVEGAVGARRQTGGMQVTQNIYTVEPRRAATEAVRKLRDAAYLGGSLVDNFGREVDRVGP